MSDLVDIIHRVNRRSQPPKNKQGRIVSVQSGIAWIDTGGTSSLQRVLIPEGVEVGEGQTVIAEYSGRNGQYIANQILGKSAIPTSTNPTHATMWHEEATVVTGNALTPTYDDLCLYSLYTFQSAAANGDTFTHTFFLAAGTYTFNVLTFVGTSRGKVDWYIDDELFLAGQDHYLASNTRNVIASQAGVVVATDGNHTLKGVVNGKNASSTGFELRFTKYWFK